MYLSLVQLFCSSMLQYPDLDAMKVYEKTKDHAHVLQKYCTSKMFSAVSSFVFFSFVKAVQQQATDHNNKYLKNK